MTTDADNLLAQRRELMDKIEEQIDERGRIIERIQSAPDTPIARLRALHAQECGCKCICGECPPPESPCDLIAALDALEEGIESARRHMYALNKAVADERDKTRSLQVRLDAATVLIEVVRDQQGTEAKPDDVFVPSISWDRWGKILDALAIVDRAWLAGDKEEHGEL